MSESVPIEDIKNVLRQYVLIKGNDAINETLIDRVSHIMLREFEVRPLSPFVLQGGPIDLSSFGGQTQQSQPTQEAAPVAAAPTSPRSRMTSGSSDTADVGASPVKQVRPPKSHEEQIEEVEAARQTAAPPVPSEEERASMRPAEGQRAVPTAQQSHFSDVINKVTAKIPDNARKSGALPQDYDEMVEESLNDQMGGEEIEVSEEGGSEHVVDVSDTDLQGIFGDVQGAAPVNPKDALALQRALPRRLDDSSEGQTQGKNRSISRVE